MKEYRFTRPAVINGCDLKSQPNTMYPRVSRLFASHTLPERPPTTPQRPANIALTSLNTSKLQVSRPLNNTPVALYILIPCQNTTLFVLPMLPPMKHIDGSNKQP